MKEGNTNTLRLLVLAFAVLVIFASYRFGFVPADEKTDVLKEENKELEAQIDVFKAEEVNKEKYQTGINNNAEECFTILEKYGGGNTPEKTVMTLVNLENTTGMQVSSIAFGTDTNLLATEALALHEGKPGVYLYRQPVSITYTASYEALKRAVDFINTYPERMNIDSVTASYDMLSGQLSGSMVINLYAVYGAKSEYFPPVTDATIPIGTDNIFGTYETPEQQPDDDIIFVDPVE